MIEEKEEATIINEDDGANFRIESYSNGKWNYITTEYSFSSAVDLITNLHIAHGITARVTSIRSEGQVLAETD